MISANRKCDEEIEQRVGAAAKVVGAMRKEVLERRELMKKTKLRVSMPWWCPHSFMDARCGLCRESMRVRYRHVK